MADQPPTPPPPPPLPPPASAPNQSTSSYIYPVRSLLSGIQPAPDADAPPPPESNVLLASLRRDAQMRTERQAQQALGLPPMPKSPPPGIGARRGVAPQGTLPISRGSLPFLRDDSVFSAPLPTKPEASSPTFFSPPSQSSSPLARRQSTTASPELAARRVVSGLETRTQQPAPDVTSPPAPAPEPFRHYPAEGRDGFLRLLHLPEGTATPTPAEQLSNTAGMAIMLHDSVDGAVIRSSIHGSKTSKASASTAGTSNTGTDASAQVSGAGSAQPSGAGSVQPRSTSSSIQPAVGPTPGSRPASTQVTSRSGTTSLSETSDEPLVTVRFQHVQDEHGHHVVVGREGRLARCEDEPIRVPGAVQGFGVLIALEEDYETGNLVVRQVSENASELLGLTPKFLFSLDCFTQTLPDSQADILWDNVQFLHDPELEPNDTADDSPQVFLLSGWGEPGSGLRDGGYFAQGAFGPAPSGEKAGPRREWTCWCAAHRPKQPQKGRDVPLSSEDSSAGGYPDPNQFDDDDADTSPLIVLEFELERDVFNPLYPPYSAALPLESPGVSSRGSGSASAGTGGTGGTGESSVTQQETPKQDDVGGGGGEHGGKDNEDGLPTEKKDKPTGVGHDAIEGTKAEDGATGQMIGEGVERAELVVPVVVGTVDEENKKGEGEGEEVKVRQGEETTPTAVPAPTPSAELDEGQVTSPQSGGGGTGESSGAATVTSGDANVSGAKGTVTDPSSEITPTQHNSGGGGGGSGDAELSPTELRGLVGEESWYPSAEDVVESTTSRSRPLRALERMRRITRDPPGSRRGAGRRFNGGGGGGGGGVGTMDVFAVLAQVNDQLGNAPDLDSFLKVVVGVIKDLTQFHRVLVYQFDEQWNGQVVAELVDWSQTHDLFKGLHFPAADIPAQARELYTINKVRLLYDRSQTTARLVVRDRADLDTPLVSLGSRADERNGVKRSKGERGWK